MSSCVAVGVQEMLSMEDLRQFDLLAVLSLLGYRRIVEHTKVLCARMWKMLSQQVGLQRTWCMLCSKFYAFFCHQSGV